MTDDTRIPLGMTLDGKKLIMSPYPYLSRIVVGGAGSAKTTSVVLPTIQALMTSSSNMILVNDPKNGECYSQIRPFEDAFGISVKCIDDFGEFGFENPNRLAITPFGAVIDAAENNPDQLYFSISKATHNIVPEVDDGGRNKWSRDGPRDNLHLGIRALTETNIRLVTTGHLYETLSDPETWQLVRMSAASNGSAALQARAKLSLDQEENEPVEYQKYLRGALQALQMYEPGTVLNTAGDDANITHRQLCDQGGIVCVVLPQRYAKEVGVHYALHQQCFMEAMMSGERKKRLFIIVDEATNSPQKSAIEAVTYARAFGISYTFIVQSLIDLERVYGAKETAVLLDNCPVQQFLSFTSYEEAEKVSRAMGEEISVNHSLNTNPERLEVSGSMSLGKQRAYTPEELMNLPPDLQVIYRKGYGWQISKKLYQNQILPSAKFLGANVLEGAPLPVDPKIDMTDWFDWDIS